MCCNFPRIKVDFSPSLSSYRGHSSSLSLSHCLSVRFDFNFLIEFVWGREEIMEYLCVLVSVGSSVVWERTLNVRHVCLIV